LGRVIRISTLELNWMAYDVRVPTQDLFSFGKTPTICGYDTAWVMGGFSREKSQP
jgi:hypothetical protein